MLGIQYIGSAAGISGTSSVERNTGTVGHDCVLAPLLLRLLWLPVSWRSISAVAAYSMISNLLVAFIALVLSVVGKTAPMFRLLLLSGIFSKVMPVIVLPFVCALLLRSVSFKTYKKVQSGQIVSFYLWAVTITILIASVTRFVVEQNTGGYTLDIFIALASLIICLLQFFFGRKIGSAFGRAIAGGQSLGQKNTVLAIWLAQTYLNPLASLGPGLYVLWQNLVNSYQIWLKKHREEKESS